MTSKRISPALFEFLSDLKANNDRTWFAENKQRYLEFVRDPMLAFIGEFAIPLAQISPHFRADPRPNGGSLFRIHRDTRFSKDKSPYKTNVGAHFRHESFKDAYSPGFYLHLEPGACFAGLGIWRPDSKSLGGIRKLIAESPQEWTDIVSASDFAEAFRLGGGSLKRPPKGFESSHPLIEDIKRKDFIASAAFPDEIAVRDDFIDWYADIARKGSSFVGFLSRGIGVAF